jgi:YD repeat-containing protein
MKPIAALALFSFFSPSASADVNMLDASFRQTFIDAQVAGLKIERRYDSRSTYLGLFGFGWCSTFDSKLDIRTLKLNDCGKTSSNAIVRYDGKTGTYVQRLTSGLTRIFDADSGALIALRSGANGPTVVIDDDRAPTSAGDTRSRLPRAAALGEGIKMRPGIQTDTQSRIRIEFDSLRENVTSLLLPDGTRLTFEYSDRRDLLLAKNAWSNTYRFQYDRLHNLTQVRYPDDTQELMEYDADRDRLLKFQGRDGCIETYEHTISSSSKERTQISTALLTCNGQPKRQATFRFGFIRKGSNYLLNSFDRSQK